MSASSQSRSATRGARLQSLFYRDLSASPATRPSGELGTGGRSAAAALWQDNLGTSEHPPPPIFSLEDRIERSPDAAFAESPSRSFFEEARSLPTRSPFLNSGGQTPTTMTQNGEKGPGSLFGSPPFQSFQQYNSPGSPNWWSPFKEGQSPIAMFGREFQRGGSPVSGVVQQPQQSGSLLTVPAMREIVRPEMCFQSNGNATGISDDGDEWVTIFGFGADDTNIVMRELEKCGAIARHVPGPGGANWIHVQFQNKIDARKALYKNGMQINGTLIIGIKPLDPMQRQALTEKGHRTVFNVLPPKTPAKSMLPASGKVSARPYYLQLSRGSQAAGPIASPAKSTFSKIVDLMFGL